MNARALKINTKGRDLFHVLEKKNKRRRASATPSAGGVLIV